MSSRTDAYQAAVNDAHQADASAGEMPDPAEVNPDAINTATGRPHSDDAELYALRDRCAAAREARREAAQNGRA
jgi:hypothetical protein